MSNVKVVVITGCSSGIGLETAVLLAKERDFKVIASMRNLQKKDALEQAAGESLGKFLVIKELDVSNEDSIVNFVKDTVTEERRIDILINNAGMGQLGIFETVSTQQMQVLFQTNFFSPVRMTQEVVTDMKKRKSGHIIFISSIMGLRPFLFADFYVASKFAIEGLVGGLAPILRCFNISITSIEPGPVGKTSLLKNMEENNQLGMGFLSRDFEVDSEDEMAPLMRKFRENYLPEFWRLEQQLIEVAQVIKECIYQKQPPVRVQTNTAITRMAEEVLVDPTGNQITRQLETYFK